jgi:eukaryotic-like serine/threonine-protein kinase
MSEQVSVEVGADGRPVAVKRARDDEGRARLRGEAMALERARHPGVVELVGVAEDDTETALSTLWLGGGAFTTVEVPPRKLASLGASLAATIADLHDRGVAHRRVTADHVLLDGLGRVVLVGFADASVEHTADDCASDVAGVGELLAAKLPSGPPPVLKLRPASPDRETLERLRSVVDRAIDPVETRRPSARSLAGLLAEIADEPATRGPIRLTRPTTSAEGPPTHPLAPAFDAARSALSGGASKIITRAVAGAAVVAAIAVVGVGAHAAFAGSSPPRAVVAEPSPTSVTLPLASTTTSLLAPRVWPTSVACPPVEATGDRRDTDGDGCPEAVTIIGSRILVDDARFEVGQDGDAIAVADWDCDGRDTPALVRPGTGEVYVFDGWATTEAPVTARLVDRVPGAVGLAPPDGSCDAVTVVDIAGTRTTLPLTTDVGP